MIEPVAQDLLRKLLVKDPHRRLGSGPRGAEDIKAHAFFKVPPPEAASLLFYSRPFRSFFTRLLHSLQTGTKVGRSSSEESAKSVQAGAEE